MKKKVKREKPKGRVNWKVRAENVSLWSNRKILSLKNRLSVADQLNVQLSSALAACKKALHNSTKAQKNYKAEADDLRARIEKKPRRKMSWRRAA